MKKRAVLTLLTGMLLMQSIPVSAQDYGGVASQTQAASVPSQFTSAIKPTDLSRITVTLPARMDLSLNEAETQYTNQSQVSAKGDLHEDYHLEVSTPSTVTYKSTGNPDVTGAVTFGTQTWTSAQLEASKTVLDSRDISVVVNNSNLKYKTYDGVLDFDIKVVKDTIDYVDYAMDDISLCTIEGNTLTIPKTFEKDGVYYKTTSIADNAFLDTDTYSSTIPYTVEEIVIPDSVTSIGDYAFYGCEWVSSVTIPDSVISIGDHAFYISWLCTVIIPVSVTYIGDYAFDVDTVDSFNYLGTRAQFVKINGYDNFGGRTIHCSDGDLPIS